MNEGDCTILGSKLVQPKNNISARLVKRCICCNTHSPTAAVNNNNCDTEKQDSHDKTTHQNTPSLVAFCLCLLWMTIADDHGLLRPALRQPVALF